MDRVEILRLVAPEFNLDSRPNVITRLQLRLRIQLKDRFDLMRPYKPETSSVSDPDILAVWDLPPQAWQRISLLIRVVVGVACALAVDDRGLELVVLLFLVHQRRRLRRRERQLRRPV